MRGSITKVFPRLGSGFVLTESGAEAYFDPYALDGIAIEDLVEGQRVEFEIYNLEAGQIAIKRLRVEDLSSPVQSRCA